MSEHLTVARTEKYLKGFGYPTGFDTKIVVTPAVNLPKRGGNRYRLIPQYNRVRDTRYAHHDIALCMLYGELKSYGANVALVKEQDWNRKIEVQLWIADPGKSWADREVLTPEQVITQAREAELSRLNRAQESVEREVNERLSFLQREYESNVRKENDRLLRKHADTAKSIAEVETWRLPDETK